MVLSATTRLFIILNITGRSQIDHVYLKRRDVSSDVPKYALTWLLEIERRIRSKMLPKRNSVEKLRIACWKLSHRSTGAKQTRANWRRFAIRRRRVFSRGQFQFLRRRCLFLSFSFFVETVGFERFDEEKSFALRADRSQRKKRTTTVGYK